MLAGVVFDFDGLILDTETAEYDAWSSVFQSYGVTLDIHNWANCVGSGPQSWSVEDHLESVLGRVYDRRAAVQAWQTARDKAILASGPLPGTVELMQELAANSIPMAIASSSRSLWVRGHLQNLGLDHYFPVIQTRDICGKAKPAPDSYLAACRDLGIEPAQTVALEDSPNGIKAAKAAGLYCIAVPNSVTKHYDCSQADLCLDTMSEMSLKRLKSIFA